MSPEVACDLATSVYIIGTPFEIGIRLFIAQTTQVT